MKARYLLAAVAMAGLLATSAPKARSADYSLDFQTVAFGGGQAESGTYALECQVTRSVSAGQSSGAYAVTGVLDFTQTSNSSVPGSPVMGAVSDALGVLTMNWTHNFLTPAQFFGFAFDIYQAEFIGGGLAGSIFHQYLLPAASGQIPLVFSGAYHVWISAQYFDGALLVADNPWTGIAYSGVPHVPSGVDIQLMETAGRDVRVIWIPEIFGTWHYQIIAFKIDDLETFSGDFVQTGGPLGTSFFHFIDFGETIFMPGTASYFEGWADFTMPTDGDYIFFIRGVPWISPFTPGEYSVSPVFTLGAP